MTVTSDVVRRYERLYSSLVSDCIEALGYPARVARPGLLPFHTDDLRVTVGPAHTAQVRKTSQRVEIDMLLEMVSATPDGSVIVVATDRDVEGALWGGLMTAGVQQRGAVGAVVDGGVRDLHQVRPLGFAVHALYRSPLDIRGRGEMVSHSEPVVFRGVPVIPEELVFADANGVVIVPAGEESAVLELAEERVSLEVRTEEELKGGAAAKDVYARHRAF